MIVCVYHSRDMDGFTSGAIVKYKYPDAIMIGYDYGEPLPWELIKKTDEVIMIDVSLPMPDMEQLVDSCSKVTWIDHHISAYKDYKASSLYNSGKNIVVVFNNEISACEGGWKYFFPDTQMPYAVQLLGEYDTWRNKDLKHWANIVLPFQFGMRVECNSPKTFPKSLLSQSDAENTDAIKNIIKTGKTILQYQAQVNEAQCKAAFDFEFEGLRAICLNSRGFNSDVFKSVYDPMKHDIMICFAVGMKGWTFSLYSTKDEVDCSVLAKKMGGGGHKKAAGFQIKDIRSIFNFI